MTVRDTAGAVVSRDQFCGRVLEVADGVVVVDRDGTPIVLPSDEAAYEPAPPGSYRLSGSGEVVVDPDYVTTWTLLERQAGSPPPTVTVPATGGLPIVDLTGGQPIADLTGEDAPPQPERPYRRW